MDPRFAASAVCRIRDLPLPRFAASAICRIRDLGGFWREALGA
jgi:hypothetical protein